MASLLGQVARRDANNLKRPMVELDLQTTENTCQRPTRRLTGDRSLAE